MNREPLSVVVTTLDNAAALARCLDSVRFADEIVVLDSGSTDATHEIAAARGARWSVEPFKGYGPQKQSAIEKATHRWVLLLDADEAVPDACRAAIEAALVAPDCDGYEIPRREQVFWRMQHEASHHNPMLRLFDRRRARMSDDGIHAQPVVDGRVGRLAAFFEHHGEPDIATKVAKVNRYSDAVSAAKHARGVRFVWLRLIVQPPLMFVKSYILRRRFLSGSAGFIGSAIDAFHVFLKYAKVIERRRRP
ncbi:MAG: glycosyltransferase family 2 protein [Xanthomonadaceae bacterium]|jgi:glycosyltransferase involved in cell wall biosynthesis|nr:glycosyltransferase family 2 protein [Xanthomonadaceae bacterium]